MKPMLQKRFLPWLAMSLFLFVCAPASEATDYYLRSDLPFVTPAITSADRFYFNIVPGRSYCLESLSTTGPSWALINTMDAVDPQMTIDFIRRGDASPPVYPLFAANLSKDGRRCFITSGNSLNITNPQLQSSLYFTGVNLGVGVVIRLLESTLSGGFNTSVTNFNFLELTNNLIADTHDNGVISGKVIVKNVITDQTIFTQNFTINPSDRIDINIHDQVGPGVFGTVTVLHNGPAGSLKGVVSQYRLVSVTPFDFEPVLQQPLLRASGLP